MELYFLRHAIAVPRGTPNYPNDDRPLTAEGIRKMEKAADGIAEILHSVDTIFTSPLKRAYETARITAAALHCVENIKVIKQLLPGVQSKGLMAELAKEGDKTRLMLVGHDSDLSVFASSLLGATASIIEMKKGSLCRIDLDTLPPTKPGILVWHLSPKILRLISNHK